jgi:hypothetical protein
MIVFGFKKLEFFFENFLCFSMGKMVGAGAEIFDKLEPEPKFVTSWSRSRTKMDRLRNSVSNRIRIRLKWTE